MQWTGALSFASSSRLASASIINVQVSHLHLLLLTIPIIISWLPTRCMALELGTPWPEDTMSMTIFTGGELSLSWNLNASDPQLFDLVLVGMSDDPVLIPGINSNDNPLTLLVNYSPQ
ncbi:hypothetical protein B0H19DRAFT_575279 [Mycena capillaripes]|nr:hypothetical protein B0H19DRAFT_575279 [Mycena capillaripes]